MPVAPRTGRAGPGVARVHGGAERRRFHRPHSRRACLKQRHRPIDSSRWSFYSTELVFGSRQRPGVRAGVGHLREMPDDFRPADQRHGGCRGAAPVAQDRRADERRLADPARSGPRGNRRGNRDAVSASGEGRQRPPAQSDRDRQSAPAGAPIACPPSAARPVRQPPHRWRAAQRPSRRARLRRTGQISPISPLKAPADRHPPLAAAIGRDRRSDQPGQAPAVDRARLGGGRQDPRQRPPPATVRIMPIPVPVPAPASAPATARKPARRRRCSVRQFSLASGRQEDRAHPDSADFAAHGRRRRPAPAARAVYAAQLPPARPAQPPSFRAAPAQRASDAQFRPAPASSARTRRLSARPRRRPRRLRPSGCRASFSPARCAPSFPPPAFPAVPPRVTSDPAAAPAPHPSHRRAAVPSDQKIDLGLAAILRGLPSSALTVSPSSVAGRSARSRCRSRRSKPTEQGARQRAARTFRRGLAGSSPRRARGRLRASTKSRFRFRRSSKTCPPTRCRIRADQVIEETTHIYPTPFSQKADEDAAAARLVDRVKPRRERRRAACRRSPDRSGGSGIGDTECRPADGRAVEALRRNAARVEPEPSRPNLAQRRRSALRETT